jgi:hypothetical protein
LAFTAFSCISIFSYFSEKLIASLFKIGHFQNVHFLKIPIQILWMIFNSHYFHICIFYGYSNNESYHIKIVYQPISQ